MCLVGGLDFFCLAVICLGIWVVHALNFPIIAKARKKEKKLKYFKKEKKIARNTGRPRQTAKPGNFTRKSAHTIPPDSKHCH